MIDIALLQSLQSIADLRSDFRHVSSFNFVFCNTTLQIAQCYTRFAGVRSPDSFSPPLRLRVDRIALISVPIAESFARRCPRGQARRVSRRSSRRSRVAARAAAYEESCFPVRKRDRYAHAIAREANDVLKQVTRVRASPLALSGARITLAIGAT